MRLVCDLVRGKNVETAVNTLRFTLSPSANVVLKTLNSAVANAETNEFMNLDNLTIIRITVNQGPRMRRFRPRSRGRAGAFNRPSCHLIVEVDEVTSNAAAR